MNIIKIFIKYIISKNIHNLETIPSFYGLKLISLLISIPKPKYIFLTRKGYFRLFTHCLEYLINSQVHHEHASSCILIYKSLPNSSAHRSTKTTKGRKRSQKQKQKMKSWTWSQSLSSLIILILFFAGLHLSDGRHFRTTTTIFPMHSTAEFYEFWRRGFANERMLSVVNSGDKDKYDDLIYGVSGREAPAGPNPLHNR